MIAAPLRREGIEPLRSLLATMNAGPGIADPHNALVPFGRFDTLHVARFVIADDETLGDLPAYGTRFDDAPVYLVFLGDCDGPSGVLLDAMAREAGDGLRRIFRHCLDFTTTTDLRGWMASHSVRPAAQYVNWIGRSVRQAREEAALHAALSARLRSVLAGAPPRELWKRLKQSVASEGPSLTPAPRTPLAWLAADLADLVGGVILLVVLALPLLIYLPVFLLILRSREAGDPVICPPPSPAKIAQIGAIDDHDVTNSFSAVGSVKPGLFRLSTVVFVLWLLNWANRHIYRRGRLARVGTIHFARWVFLDGRRRLLFASNYDGDLDSYMDDFINKAGFGLNLVFGNGIGYPRTRLLLGEGALNEEQFKAFLRRHQVPTDVWYKAYPGLTTLDLARNAEIRRGLERDEASDSEIVRWLALIR